MSTVRLGNSQAIHHGTGEHLDGDRVTQCHIPDDMSLDDAVAAITHAGQDTQGVWATHSRGDAPDWVASDDDALATRIGNHYGCEIRHIDDTGETVIADVELGVDTDHTDEDSGGGSKSRARSKK